MKSTASVGKHPIHPALIVFPIALFIASFIFDLTYLNTGNTLWYRIAYYNIVLGIIGALLAAIPGFIDYFTVRMSDRARNKATTHMLLNLAVVVIFISNAIVRYDNRALSGLSLTWAIILSVVGIGVMSYAGWLGADLVHRHGVAVDLSEIEAEEREAQRQRGAAGMQPGWAGAKGGETPEGESDQ